MTDWQDLRHFLALAKSGSLSAAARALDVEHATVARRITGLEAALGIRLVDRRGRRMTLTPEGERVAGIAARMDEEAQALARVRAAAQGLEGEVTLSVPPSYAMVKLMEPLATLRKAHPGLRLKVLGETRYVSLERREADIAVRLARPDKGDFTVRRFDEFAMRLYASPDYLRTHTPDNWDFIAYDEVMDEAPQQRRLKEHAGARGYAMRASSLEMQCALARLGCGVAMLPDFMAAGDPSLQPADPEAPPFRREVWLAVHSDIKDVPAIRVTIDALCGAIPVTS